MDVKKLTQYIDISIRDLQNELQNFCWDMKNSMTNVPQGGYFVGETIRLSRLIARVNAEFDKYYESEIWRQIAERKICDEINLGTLLNIESVTRSTRERMLFHEWNNVTSPCVTSEASELNSLLCYKANKLKLTSIIEFQINQLLEKMVDLYKAEHPEKLSTDKLMTLDVQIPDLSKFEPQMMDLFTSVYSLFDTLEFVIKTIANIGLKEVPLVLSQLTMLVFETDNAIRVLDAGCSRFESQSNIVKPTFNDYLQSSTLKRNADRTIAKLQNAIKEWQTNYPEYAKDHQYKAQSIPENNARLLLVDELDKVCDTSIKLLEVFNGLVQKYAELTKNGEGAL